MEAVVASRSRSRRVVVGIAEAAGAAAVAGSVVEAAVGLEASEVAAASAVAAAGRAGEVSVARDSRFPIPDFR